MGGCDILVRNEGDYFSYVAWYCDDLIIVHKEPDHVFDYIGGNGFTIKETSDTDEFLGGYFERVKEPKTNNEFLTWGSKTYVKRTMENFKNTFNIWDF